MPILDVDAPQSHPSTLYDLIANVTHESVAGTTRDKENTVWKTHLRAASGGGEGEKWFQIQDLIVEETRKEMIFLGETVLQVSSSLLRLILGIPDMGFPAFRFGNDVCLHRGMEALRTWKSTGRVVIIMETLDSHL